MRDIFITPNRGLTGTSQYPKIEFYGLSQSFITLKVDNDGSVKYTGTYGTLFNITDSKDGLLHSVNDISGLPILSVYSYDYVQLGKWDKNALIVNSDKVGIGLTAPSTLLHISSTQSGAFRLQDTTQAAGYVLISDANGVGTWGPASGGIVDSGTIQLANGQAVVNTTNVVVGSKIFLTYAGDAGSGWTFSAFSNTFALLTDSIVANTSFNIEAFDGAGSNDTGNNAWVHWMIL